MINEILNLDNPLNKFLKLGIQALDKSREITKDVDYSKSSFKKDGSLLTEFDLKVEEEIFNILSKSDGDIITEEILGRKDNKDYCWYIDPIDGTTSFSRGIPLFGTIIGLTHKKKPIMGLIDIPKLKDRFISVVNFGAEKNGQKIKASTSKVLSESLITYGSPQRFEKEGMLDKLHIIDSLAWDSRGCYDCFGYSLAFSGAVDLVIEVDLNLWETVALESLAKESGAGYAEQSSVNGKKNLIFGSKYLIEESIDIMGGDWSIQ
jgi:fructose-1,6-bisphosphatase/inositol monophosphatase family enzyme|tara:strand:- start:2466 stop:3254 length:789 start_codon:yes stop_codon:yes gene_type:complete